MTYQCNGCGGEFEELGGTLAYDGGVEVEESGPQSYQAATRARYHKTLCPRCQHVMKDILLSSDLSEHWHKYEWSMVGEQYVEPYDDD